MSIEPVSVAIKAVEANVTAVAKEVGVSSAKMSGNLEKLSPRELVSQKGIEASYAGDASEIQKYQVQDCLSEKALETNRINYGKEICDPEIKINEWKMVEQADLSEKRSEFNQNKSQHIADWEAKHNQPWPRYGDDVYSDNGRLLRSAGDRYDAHHKQPLSMGGENSANNLTPLHVNDHFDHKGVHRPDGALNTIKSHLLHA